MKWISVKDRFPELKHKNRYGDFSDYVLLLTESGAIEGMYNEDGSFIFISLNIHGCGCCSTEDDVVTHWMPLPEPPNI